MFSKKKLSFQNLTLKIQTILQHMLPIHKPKNIMTHYISLIYDENNSILLDVNLYYLLMFIIT